MRKIHNLSQGFTLLEILIVITIIGILSGVVLTFVASARDQAGDASIKQSLGDFRKEAAAFYNDDTLPTAGTYSLSNRGPTQCLSPLFSGTSGSVFGTQNPQGLALLTSAINASGAPVSTASRCRVTLGPSGRWVVGVALRSSPTTSYLCVDDTGITKIVNASVAFATFPDIACP